MNHFLYQQIFDYERLVQILLFIVTEHKGTDNFVQRAGIFLLNSLACQVMIDYRSVGCYHVTHLYGIT